MELSIEEGSGIRKPESFYVNNHLTRLQNLTADWMTHVFVVISMILPISPFSVTFHPWVWSPGDGECSKKPSWTRPCSQFPPGPLVLFQPGQSILRGRIISQSDQGTGKQLQNSAWDQSGLMFSPEKAEQDRGTYVRQVKGTVKLHVIYEIPSHMTQWQK